MKKNASVVLAATLISFLASCFLLKKSPEKILIGTWNDSIYVSPAEAAKKAEGPIPEGMSLEISASGSVTYHNGYRYNGDGEVTLRLRKGEEERALRFYMRETGVWKIHNGDVLVETSEDSSVTPLDNLTKEAVENVPELKAMVSPVKGETTSYKIKEISDSNILLEEKESGLTIVLKRKS